VEFEEAEGARIEEAVAEAEALDPMGVEEYFEATFAGSTASGSEDAAAAARRMELGS
jgi:hypothetical protein